ncbi:uncharacterized protein LOC125108272 [Lutra lutra]|uniref:uncharacterized protein LOC125108272 n=1 Tax=Lutra lutra TaxID=9657 RepID=UPI001FD47B6C|nr:uncharacterized protein LOC125108272 [Lutra lutra]
MRRSAPVSTARCPPEPHLQGPPSGLIGGLQAPRSDWAIIQVLRPDSTGIRSRRSTRVSHACRKSAPNPADSRRPTRLRPPSAPGIRRSLPAEPPSCGAGSGRGRTELSVVPAWARGSERLSRVLERSPGAGAITAGVMSSDGNGFILLSLVTGRRQATSSPVAWRPPYQLLSLLRAQRLGGPQGQVYMKERTTQSHREEPGSAPSWMVPWDPAP